MVSLDWLLKQWVVCGLYCIINWTECFSETFNFNLKNRIVFALHVCSLFQALANGFFDFETFDVDEYEHYEVCG